ncbi:MAG: hypothetical protein R3Y28_00650 [Candidatus Gastranaerophilales bacterium]
MRTITLLKELLYNKGLNLKYVANELELRLKKPYSLANLSNKLRNDTISYREMLIIADIIDCELKIVDKLK